MGTRGTIYLAGPMRTIEKLNYPRFFAMAKMLEHDGWEVHNPAQKDVDELGIDPDNPVVSDEQVIKHCMPRNLVDIYYCDVFAMLEGWACSHGVMDWELPWAVLHRKRIVRLHDSAVVEGPEDPFVILTDLDIYDWWQPCRRQVVTRFDVLTGANDTSCGL